MEAKILESARSVQTITYATSKCSLGSVLVATTSKGICALLLGDSHEELAQTLQKCLPGAVISQDQRRLATILRDVAAFVDKPSTPLPLPLDPIGTPFQIQVWQALREVPCGETITYGALAQHLGLAPRAARAIGAACAANIIAIAVPCHRVLRSDGNLSGFRWGVERKRELLRRESALPELF